MGRKIRYIIILLLVSRLAAKGQEALEYSRVDSLTYNYYLTGKWDSLIKLGNDAIVQNIDYKYLRQRIGFAFFSKSEYGQAQKQFTQALSFDSFDDYTLKYLYLSYLYEGNDDGASVIAGKMNKETREGLQAKLFKPIESIEFEYNFKYAGTSLRSHPQYFHFGISSRLGARLSLFQMYSNYSQTITVRLPNGRMDLSDKQPEYYALLKYSFSPNLKIKTAYHYLNTSSTLDNRVAQLLYVGFSADYPGFRLGSEFSVMNLDNNMISQAGLMAGFKTATRTGFYMTGELSYLMKEGFSGNLIYNQKAGLRLSAKTWLEGNITFGNLSDFNELSAMYIYNTVDPTSFRCGSTLFLFPGKRISLWFNFSYERKDFYENVLYYYNQFSYLGGIKWKIGN